MTVKSVSVFKQTTLGNSDFQDDWMTKGTGSDSTSSTTKVRKLETADVYEVSMVQRMARVTGFGSTAADLIPLTEHAYFRST